MYLTYNDYKNMGGTLEESVYEDLEFEARAQIDYYTFNRLKSGTKDMEELHRCVYKLVGLINQLQRERIDSISGGNGTGAIASMSNDGVSVSYNVLSASEAAQALQDDIEKCIRRYLADVRDSQGRRALYRGLYPGE